MSEPSDQSFQGPGQAEFDKFKNRLTRTKTIASQSSMDEEGQQGDGGSLQKVLTTFDLISLGVGSCCGTGMYVVAGLVAKNVAGPGAMLSFFFAALASVLSGVCYGEFGVRVPKTSGSAYMYSYVTVGEFVAFLIGWNLILEYMIGSAAGASALSACFDALANHSMSAYLEENVGTVIGNTYPDFLGFCICLVMTVVLSAGGKTSVRINSIFNGVNFLIWIFIIIAGFFYVDGSNWTSAGFFPYGASGVFSGAATCFYAFIGFDIIATTGAEAKNPSRSIPIAIFTSLIICLCAYISVTMILTLMVPYYEIHGTSALIDMFVQRGLGGAKWVVAIGALCALTVSLLGSMFPMPRVIYAMARDGLLFRFLSNINPITNTPLLAIVITGSLASLMSLLVSLRILVEMMSIGTLLAYTLVAVSVLILRYQPDKGEMPIPMAHRLETIEESPDYDKEDPLGAGDDVFLDPTVSKRKHKDDQHLISPTEGPGAKTYGSLPFGTGSYVESKYAMVKRHWMMLCLRLGFPSDDVQPNDSTAKMAMIFTGLLAACEMATCALIVFGSDQLAQCVWWAVILLLVFIAATLACLVVILRQPQNKRKLTFMAPAVPYLPCLAMFFNIYLMLKLPPITWARLGIWILVGLLLYFSYSMWHSVKERKQKEKELREKQAQEVAGEPLGTQTGPTSGQTLLNGTTPTPDLTTTQLPNTTPQTDIGKIHQPTVPQVNNINSTAQPDVKPATPPGGPPMNGGALRERPKTNAPPENIHAKLQRQPSGPKPKRPPISAEGWGKMRQSSIERLGYFPAEEQMKKELGLDKNIGREKRERGSRNEERHRHESSGSGGSARYDRSDEERDARHERKGSNESPGYGHRHHETYHYDDHSDRRRHESGDRNPFVGRIDDDLNEFDPLADSYREYGELARNRSSGNNPFRQPSSEDDFERSLDYERDSYAADDRADRDYRSAAQNPYARPRPRPKVRPQNSNPFIEPLRDPGSDRQENPFSGAW